MDSYYLCLEAWNMFLDHVITTCAESQAGRTPPEGSHQMKYPHSCVDTHMHARTHSRTHAHTHARTHARTHTHTHTHTHTYTWLLAALRYKEPLLSLMDGLLKKMLMDFNLVELSELDDDRLDSDVSVWLGVGVSVWVCGCVCVGVWLCLCVCGYIDVWLGV